MASTVGGVSLSTPTKILAKAASHSPRTTTCTIKFQSLINNPWKNIRIIGSSERRLNMVRPIAAAPDQLSDKVAESVKAAEETCAGDPASGECVAAWDEVEELSAAASHKRVREKESDPLENYCKDNPETDECRTYDN